MGACTSKEKQTVDTTRAPGKEANVTNVELEHSPQQTPTTIGEDVETPEAQEGGSEAEEEEDVWEGGEDADAVGAEGRNSSRRRRLSVSTVDSKPPREAVMSGELIPGAVVDADGNKGAPVNTIVKYNDPALQLVDRSKGQVKEVTLKMLKELFPNSDHYAVFGSPCRHVQRGFDNKLQEIDGSLPDSKTLQDRGIGFACKKGLKPESPNQDDFFILKIDDWFIYGVCDGHGPCGHDISGFVHKTLPFLLISDPLFEKDVLGTLKRAFWRVHHLVEAAAEQANSTMDCSLSGTTVTVVVHRNNKLYIAHVGDSRSVIAQKVDGKFVAHNLTQDHKPTNPKELARIEASGGEVRRLEGDIPHRVFVSGRMYPGLAMSRAVGDTVGAAVGVTPDPDLRVHNISKDDKFFIISTDGVWEFISSQEAVSLVAKKKRNQVQAAAEALAYEAWTRWVEEEENVVDDVTCVIIWLNPDDGSSSAAGRSSSKRKSASQSRSSAAAAKNSVEK